MVMIMKQNKLENECRAKQFKDFCQSLTFLNGVSDVTVIRNKWPLHWQGDWCLSGWVMMPSQRIPYG
jgi:hypothetical protein